MNNRPFFWVLLLWQPCIKSGPSISGGAMAVHMCVEPVRFCEHVKAAFVGRSLGQPLEQNGTAELVADECSRLYSPPPPIRYLFPNIGFAHISGSSAAGHSFLVLESGTSTHLKSIHNVTDFTASFFTAVFVVSMDQYRARTFAALR